MNRAMKSILLTASALSSFSAFAALFDTIESVQPLQEIAAQKQKTADRMPAGKSTDATDEKNSEAEKETTRAETE